MQEAAIIKQVQNGKNAMPAWAVSHMAFQQASHPCCHKTCCTAQSRACNKETLRAVMSDTPRLSGLRTHAFCGAAGSKLKGVLACRAASLRTRSMMLLRMCMTSPQTTSGESLSAIALLWS